MAEVEEVQAPATLEEPETPAAPETAEPESKEGEKKPKGGFQKRIDRLTRRNYDLEQRAEKLMQAHQELIDRLASKPAATEAKAETGDDEPKESDFTNWDQYQKALTRWAARQELKIERQQQKESEAKSKQEQEQQSIDKAFKSHYLRVEEARGRYEDFDEVVEKVGQDQLAVPQSVGLAIVELDNGPDVAYYLGKHPEVCGKLNAMSPLKAVAEIGRISSTLITTKPEPEEAEPAEEVEEEEQPISPKKVTPVPIKPVKKSAPTENSLSDEEPIEKWLAKREAQLRKK